MATVTDSNLYFSRDTKVFVQKTKETAALQADFASGDTVIKFTDALGVKVSIGDSLKNATGVLIGIVTAISRGNTNVTNCTVAATSVAGTAADVITIEKPVYEIPVLDGFSFTQATNASEVTLAEMASSAGTSRRGRRMFTDSYSPAEWSFQTYARPYKSAGSVAGNPHSASHTHAVEEVMWALFAGDANKDDDGDSFAASPSSAGTTQYMTSDATDLNINFSQSNKVTLGTADIFFVLGGSSSSNSSASPSGAAAADDTNVTIQFADAAAIAGVQQGDLISVQGKNVKGVVKTVNVATDGTTAAAGRIILTDPLNTAIAATDTVQFNRALCYKIEKCVVNEAAFEFDIDGIASINWSGNGTIIAESAIPTASIAEGITSTDSFIRNRLTSLTAVSSVSGSSVSYDLVLTGGSVTLSNNLTFITPEQLGQVNQPFAHVTGGRNVGGSFTCYLNTGDDSSAELFDDLLAANTTITNSFNLTFKVGGSANPRVEINAPSCHLELPSHSIEDVISVETNFHALPSTISSSDEVTLTYVAP